MLKLIVHADDFGISEKVNEGIITAHKKGILTSTSIIVSGKAFNNAIKIAKGNPSLDLGIHLTLIEEKPVLPPQEVKSLLNSKNMFFQNSGGFIKRYINGKISMEEVKKELEEQVQIVLDQGLKITHLDSHNHIHMLPKILQITQELAKKYHIPYIRFPKENLKFFMLKNIDYVFRIIQMVALNAICLFEGKKILKKTEHFIGFLYGGNLNKDNLIIVLNHLPKKGTCELMCHPGMPNDKDEYKHWQYHPVDELNALISPEIKEIIDAKKIDLISYKDLIPSLTFSTLVI